VPMDDLFVTQPVRNCAYVKGVHSDPGGRSAPGVGLHPLESTMKPPRYEYRLCAGLGSERSLWGTRLEALFTSQ
jgi:hypothetical protein